MRQKQIIGVPTKKHTDSHYISLTIFLKVMLFKISIPYNIEKSKIIKDIKTKMFIWHIWKKKRLDFDTKKEEMMSRSKMRGNFYLPFYPNSWKTVTYTANYSREDREFTIVKICGMLKANRLEASKYNNPGGAD